MGMRCSTQSPLGAVARGLVAGLVGTAAMTVHQELASKIRASRSVSSSSDADQQPPDPWDEAPAPAIVAKRVIEGVFSHRVPAERIGTLTNVAHWTYGTAWGAVFGLLQGTVHLKPLLLGPAFGGGMWASSYAQLVPMGLYQPPWRYPPKTLANDLGYHTTYGLGVAIGYALLAPD